MSLVHSPSAHTQPGSADTSSRPVTVDVTLCNSMRVTLEDNADGRLITLWNEASEPIADADLPATVQLTGDASALRAATTLAAETFHRYAQMHWAKNTPDGWSKAIANAELATQMQAALAADNARISVEGPSVGIPASCRDEPKSLPTNGDSQ